MKIEARRMFRPNGLIDDLVVYGSPEDYLIFAEFVGKAIGSRKPTLMLTETDISFEIILDDEKDELFTSLQNMTNDYLSIEEWNDRNILRVYGSANILTSLQSFLVDISSRSDGYSYISEYSESYSYSTSSPEWRLHVETT